MPSEVGQINQVTNAQFGRKIKIAEDGEIEKLLQTLFVMVGLRAHHLPEGEEVDVLLTFIRFNYAETTIDEFILAFNLALQDKLDIETKDVKVYDVFSAAYLATIMSAYRRWLVGVIKNKATIKPIQQEQHLLEDKKEMTDEEWTDFIENVKKSYCTPKDFILIPPFVYDYLKRTQKLVLSPEQENYFTTRAFSIYKASLLSTPKELNELMEMYDKGFLEGKHMNNVITITKQLIIWKHVIGNKVDDITKPKEIKVKQLK